MAEADGPAPASGPVRLIKIIIIGDSGVGKSALLKRYLTDAFSKQYVSTVGVDFETKLLTLNNERISLQLWDTAGQERFRTITTSYYRGAQGILLAYDITNRKTFRELNNWLESVRECGRPGVQCVLVGNKTDLASMRDVPRAEAEVWSQGAGMPFFEASAKNGENVETLFTTLVLNAIRQQEVELMEQRNKEREKNNVVKLGNDDEKEDKCCN